MEPLVFQPLIKQIRWGGRRLGTVLQKPIGDAADYAESWEVADQPDGRSIVASGTYAGRSLHELMKLHPAELMGRHASLTQFPLLIKFLDANDWLSLQVHPNDQQAVRYNPDENGKTEAWVILDAQPDSQICAGLKQGVTREQFAHHLADGTIEETLHLIPVKAGDCVFVPAQTVHALGPGILLAEVQQQSNLTFRLYDWGRVGSDGKPREVHVEQSLDCTDFTRGPVNPVTPDQTQSGDHTVESLVECDYFCIHRHTATNPFCISVDDRFRILMLLQGSATVKTRFGAAELKRGSTVLLPACSIDAEVTPTSSSLILLEVFHPA